MTKKKHPNDPNLKFPGTLKSRLRITKIAETRPSAGIPISTIRTGILYSNVIPGESLILMYCEETGGRTFETSIIESINFNTKRFITKNSTYTYDVIHSNK